MTFDPEDMFERQMLVDVDPDELTRDELIELVRDLQRALPPNGRSLPTMHSSSSF